MSYVCTRQFSDEFSFSFLFSLEAGSRRVPVQLGASWDTRLNGFSANHSANHKKNPHKLFKLIEYAHIRLYLGNVLCYSYMFTGSLLLYPEGLSILFSTPINRMYYLFCFLFNWLANDYKNGCYLNYSNYNAMPIL